MSTALIFLAIDVGTIVCAALLAIQTLTDLPHPRGARLIGLIALCTACGVILAHQEYGPWMPTAFRIEVGGWAVALNLARNLTPGLFMVLCHGLFTDQRRFPRWLLILLAIQLGLEEPGRTLVPTSWRFARLVTQIAPALLQSLFAGLALYWTLADWRVDLVERRRRTRILTSAIIGLVTIASSLLTRVLIDPHSKANYLAHVALNASFLAILALVLFRLMDGGLRRYIDSGRIAPPEKERRLADGMQDKAVLGRLTALLEGGQVCQEAGLSIRRLADRVGIPEYRLRKLIHEQLGYQNFNALLHDYRVKAACEQLRDPDLRRTPILTIALSVGYSSANTFNRGFREVMGMTPSNYRSVQLASRVPEIAPETPKSPQILKSA